VKDRLLLAKFSCPKAVKSHSTTPLLLDVSVVLVISLVEHIGALAEVTVVSTKLEQAYAETVRGDEEGFVESRFISRIMDVGVMALGQGICDKSKLRIISLLPPVLASYPKVKTLLEPVLTWLLESILASFT
jgi:hypothetical protein